MPIDLSAAESSHTPVRLYARDLGGAGKPPLILLHALLGSSRNWQSAGGDLAARYHVTALDLRNHGRSPHAADMNYAAMMHDVLAWLDAEGLARVTLLGHSMGGKVAMLLACRHPERVERLIVVDIAAKTYSSNAHHAEFAAMNSLDLRALNSRAEAEARFEAFIPDWGMRKFLTTNLERATSPDQTPVGAEKVAPTEVSATWKWVVNLPALTASLPEIEANSLAAADKFNGPTDFIIGEKSSYVLPADYATIREHFPYSRVATIAGAGHNPHMETRDAFVRVVLG